MRCEKTLSNFGVGLGVFGGRLTWSASRPIWCGLSLWFIPFGVLFRLSAFCGGGGGCWIPFALHGKKHVMYNVFLLPSVLAFAQIILRALYLLYTAALRNLSEFKRVKTDHLIVVHIGKNNRLYALLRVIVSIP